LDLRLFRCTIRISGSLGQWSKALKCRSLANGPLVSELIRYGKHVIRLTYWLGVVGTPPSITVSVH
jgi:hypothetical protein